MNINKLKTSSLGLITLLLMAPVTAFAGADSGFYLGAGIGDSTIKANGFDESDTGYKLFGGYNIGFIPLVDFAVEASYVNFGTPEDVTGLNAYGLAGLSFGPFGIFAKLGAMSWDANSDSGTDTAYGIGARLAFGSFSVRAEYEEFDVSDVNDFSMTSISAVYTF